MSVAHCSPTARRSSRASTALLPLACASLALVLAAPAPARACGGFFCSSTPIEQSAERVVYAYESDGSLTMAVEVQYAGRDEDFAWVLPVPLPPTITLGTAALFDTLSGASTPTFTVTSVRTEGTCREVPRCVRDDGSELAVGSCGYDITTATPDYVDTPAPPPPPAPMTGSGMMDGVTVYSTAAVGPYETVVLGAATAAEVTTWLREHGYRVPSATARLLEPYVTQGYVFVALRLRANRVSSVLRPVVLRTPAPADGGIAEACLPIRLTPVASASTLPITAFFLADQLVTPLNYSLVELDLVDAALYSSPRTYAARVARGADALGGHGFAVDYAGRMPRLGILHPSVSDLAEQSDPGEFLREINRRGYMGDRILQDLLEAYMPPPTGELPGTYYNCLVAGLATCGAPRSFDPARLAAAIESEITAPRAEAEALLQRHVRLTRLSTELSPPEMTIDPVFVRDVHLPEVSNRHPAARVIRCGPAYFPGQAPEDLVIGDRTIPLSAGLGSTDADYCATFGATVATGRASTRARECGYSGCSVGAGSRPTPLLLLTLLSAAWLLRRRRA